MKPNDPRHAAFCSDAKRIILSGRHFILAEYPSLDILLVAPGARGGFDLSPDGRYAVAEPDSDHEDSIPRIIDMRTGSHVADLKYAKRGDYEGGKFSPDGKYFYMWGEFGWIEKWDFESKTQLWAKRERSLLSGAKPRGLDIDRGGRFLLVHPRELKFKRGSVAILDTATGNCIHRFPGLAQIGKFSPKNDYVLVSNGEKVQKYSIGTWKPLGDPGDIDPPAENYNEPMHLGVFPSARWCYLVRRKLIHFWSTRDMSESGEFRLLEDEVYVENIAIHPDEGAAVVMVTMKDFSSSVVLCNIEYER